MAPRATIGAIGYLAVRPDISFESARAAGIPLNHGLSEEILPLAPDVVLAGRHTSRPAVLLLQRLGYTSSIRTFPAPSPTCERASAKSARC